MFETIRSGHVCLGIDAVIIVIFVYIEPQPLGRHRQSSLVSHSLTGGVPLYIPLSDLAAPNQTEWNDEHIPARLKRMVPARVPQLHVGLGEPIVDVQVGRLELEDAHHVRRAILLRNGVLRRVGDEVGEHGLAGLKDY